MSPPLPTYPLPYTLVSLPERHQCGSAAKKRRRLRGFSWVCSSSTTLLILPYHWAWTHSPASLLLLPSPEDDTTAQQGKTGSSTVLVILGCYKQPGALYTLDDLPWYLNWSQHTWISSPNYQVVSTALKLPKISEAASDDAAIRGHREGCTVPFHSREEQMLVNKWILFSINNNCLHLMCILQYIRKDLSSKQGEN